MVHGYWYVVEPQSLQLTVHILYFPTAANEPEVLHIHRKRLTSTLKNKEDTPLLLKAIATLNRPAILKSQ